jgi:hypothetical protein
VQAYWKEGMSSGWTAIRSNWASAFAFEAVCQNSAAPRSQPKTHEANAVAGPADGLLVDGDRQSAQLEDPLLGRGCASIQVWQRRLEAWAGLVGLEDGGRKGVQR